jgi:hypothetical protein
MLPTNRCSQAGPTISCAGYQLPFTPLAPLQPPNGIVCVAGIVQVRIAAPFFSVIENQEPPLDCAPTQNPTREDEASSEVPVVHAPLGAPLGGSVRATPVALPQRLLVIVDSIKLRLGREAPR